MSNEFYAVIGARIKAMREARGLTQEALGKKIGLSREAISTLETGRHRVFLHYFVDIADVLGIAVNELLGDGTAKTEQAEQDFMLSQIRSHHGWREDLAKGGGIVEHTKESLRCVRFDSPEAETQRKRSVRGMDALLALGQIELSRSEKKPEKPAEPKKGRRLEDVKGGRVFVIMAS